MLISVEFRAHLDTVKHSPDEIVHVLVLGSHEVT